MTLDYDIESLSIAKGDIDVAISSFKRVLDQGSIEFGSAVKLEETIKYLRNSSCLIENQLNKLEKLKARVNR